jgi:hypothetical protein
MRVICCLCCICAATGISRDCDWRAVRHGFPFPYRVDWKLEVISGRRFAIGLGRPY